MEISYRKISFRDKETFVVIKNTLIEKGAELKSLRFPLGDKYIAGYSQNYVRENLELEGKVVKLEYNSFFGITWTRVTINQKDGLVSKIVTDNGLKKI